jgi:hypothetical protein
MEVIIRLWIAIELWRHGTKEALEQGWEVWKHCSGHDQDNRWKYGSMRKLGVVQDNGRVAVL